MTHLLTIAANTAAFLLALRLIPGFDFAYGRAYWKLGIVLATVSLFATYGPAVIARFMPIRRAAARGTAIVAGASFVGLTALVLAVGLLSGWLGLGLDLGGFPAGLSLNALGVVLAVGLIVSVIPVGLLLVRGADGPLPLPDLRAIASIRASRSDAVLLMFFASGAAGLAYEVVWARQLVLVFGNTTQATSAILTGFFGGLAIGSVVGGRVADRVRSPLRLYGVIEIVLVVVVILTPLLFRGINELYRSSYPSFESSPTALALFRFGLAILALAPATVLMGATLPTLSRYLTTRARDLSGNFARLYAMNTIGAVVGTSLAGFVLIELFGLTATLLVGALASGGAGIAAIALSTRTEASRGLDSDDAAPLEPSSATVAAHVPGISPDRTLGLTVAFVSGLTSLGYQVLWTRLLASGSGNSTYVFTLILSIFLVGIAIGAAVYARRLSESARLIGILGLAQLAIAAIALAGLPIIALLVDLPLVVRTLLVVLPATLVLGLTLPMASRLVGGSAEHVGRDAGLLLGSNTLGAICGTFVVPFALIPTLGSPHSVAALALMNALLGAFLVVRVHGLPIPRPILGAGGLALIVAAVGAIAVPTRLVGDPGLAQFDQPPAELFAAAEDEIASVQAGIGRNGTRSLVVGGTGMTALTIDARFMTYLPLMLRPEARDLLVIAFGMGSSWRSGLIAGMRSDAVELVPSVPGMLRYFHSDADAIVANPAGKIIVADGRNYAELTNRRYDIVVVDPPPPVYSSGTAILYSQEFYQASGSVLNEDGVMMEWMPYGQRVDEFRAHVRTFASVFPNVALVFGPGRNGVFMLGSTGPLSFDADIMRGVLERPGVPGDLATTVDAPVSTVDEWLALIRENFWLDDAGARAFGGAGPLITDDHPLPEYFLLRSLVGEPSPRMNEPNLRAAAPTTLR